MGAEQKGWLEQAALVAFIAVPFAAILLAIPVAWGGWLGWSDVLLSFLFYAVAGHGITVGFPPFFTHGSFRQPAAAHRLAVGGHHGDRGPRGPLGRRPPPSSRVQRRDGDPHFLAVRRERSALIAGLWHAHTRLAVRPRETRNARRFAPRPAQGPGRALVPEAVGSSSLLFSLGFPPLLGGLLTWSWHGALTAFFWASLVRVGLLHHVTWSINSICHAMGERPFESRDRSGNVWWLAVLSMGESWHNLHHADPTCAARRAARSGRLRRAGHPAVRGVRMGVRRAVRPGLEGLGVCSATS